MKKELVDIINKIIVDRPRVHQHETEISRSWKLDESLLPREYAEKVVLPGTACYAPDADVLLYIASVVEKSSLTLETGSGCSTLVFAACGCKHVAITPSKEEIDAIIDYAEHNEISLEDTVFVQEPSEHYLPNCELTGFDVIFLDGKHAFPWPIIDWFFTADRLIEGGIMIIDDAQMRSVRVVVDFMQADPGWKQVWEYSGKALAFRKLRGSVLDVAWHMQPFTVGSSEDIYLPKDNLTSNKILR